jgi:hypothetical protein
MEARRAGQEPGNRSTGDASSPRSLVSEAVAGTCTQLYRSRKNVRRWRGWRSLSASATPRSGAKGTVAHRGELDSPSWRRGLQRTNTGRLGHKVWVAPPLVGAGLVNGGVAPSPLRGAVPLPDNSTISPRRIRG